MRRPSFTRLPAIALSKHWQWGLRRTVSAGLLVGLLTLTACGPAAKTEAGTASPSGNGAPGEANNANPQIAADPDSEAAAREALQAQMEQVSTVIQGMDRTALIAESSTKGPVDAPVVLLKFSDFQCPYCAIASSDMKTFTENNREDVLYVYKQLPLESIHPEAMPAAKASWAAGQQDQFWLYHDGLFAYQDRLGEDYYVELAEQIGLDIDQFNKDRNSPAAEAAIQKDMDLAKKLGLRGTPSFVMNEIFIPGGVPIEFFDAAVERLKAEANLQTGE